MTTLSTLSDITAIDLTDEELGTGDTTVVPTRFDSMQAKIEVQGAELATLQDEAATAFGEIETAINNLESDSEGSETRLASVEESTSQNSAALAAALLKADLNKAQNNQLNYASDHGSFIEAAEPKGFPYGAPNALFNNRGLSDFVSGYNGANVNGAYEVGRHRRDSATYGGIEPADDAVATEFLSAMFGGNTSLARYVPSFAVLEIVAGAGVAWTNHNGRYRFLRAANMFTSASKGGDVSCAFWYKPVDEDAYIQGYVPENRRQTYINGLTAASDEGEGGTEWHKLNANQVYHIAMSYANQDSNHVSADNPMSHLLGLPNKKHQIAAFRVAHGAFQLMPHKGLIMTMRGAQ